MKTNWKNIDKMSRMSREQFQNYDQGLRNKEQAAQQRKSTQAADSWLAEINKGGEPAPQKTPNMFSFDEFTADAINRTPGYKEFVEKNPVRAKSNYESYIENFRKTNYIPTTPQEQKTAVAQRMMQEDQFRIKAAQKGFSPQTIDYIIRNKVPTFTNWGRTKLTGT
jgi:hypothetical protein